MKKRLFAGGLLMFSVLSLVWVLACNRDEDPNSPEGNNILIENTECKDYLKSGDQIWEVPDTLSCVDLSYNAAEKKLHILHSNVVFNCAASIRYSYEIVDNRIIITEVEDLEMAANCMCLFDLSMTLNVPIPQVYTIEIIEPYLGSYEAITFEVDIRNEEIEPYCVVRTDYPYGLSQI